MKKKYIISDDTKMVINTELLTEIQAAEQIGVPRRTLQRWRRENNGPYYEKIGQSIRYPKEFIDLWVLVLKLVENE